MDGITILNTIENYKTIVFWDQYPVIGFIIILLFILLLASAFVMLLSDFDNSWSIIMLPCCLIAILITGAIGNIKTEKFCYYSYEVLIDDTISWQELNRQYEILNRDGDIYTIKEREITKRKEII